MFSRNYCEREKMETFFHGRKCSTPNCGYEKANKPEPRKPSIWDEGQKKRAKQTRGQNVTYIINGSRYGKR